MTRTDITTGEQAVSATGAVTGSLSIASLTAGSDFTVKVRVSGLSASKYLNIAVEDTVDAYTNKIAVMTHTFTGGMPTDGSIIVFNSKDYPTLRVGTASAAMRVFVTSITATPGSVLLYAWLEQ